MLFKILIYILAIVGSLAVLCAAGFAIGYAILARRLADRMRQTVLEMEGLLSQTIDAASVEHIAAAVSSSVPPMRIHLECIPSNAMPVSALGKQIEDWLRGHSFIKIGDYLIQELSAERLRIFLSEDRLLVASMRFPSELELPYVEFCFDLGNRQRGGVSNPPTSTLQLPPDAVGKFFKGSLEQDFEVLSQMWLEAKELVDRHDVQPVDRELIAEFYEEAHAAEMDCRISNGGVSENEIRSAFLAQGISPTTEDVDEIQEQWQDAIEDHLLDFSSRGLNEYHAGSQILVVHDGSVQSYLLNRIRDLLDDEGQESPDDLASLVAELQALLDKFPPRDAMARFRPLLPKRLRYDLVDQLKRPVEADLYALP